MTKVRKRSPSAERSSRLDKRPGLSRRAWHEVREAPLVRNVEVVVLISALVAAEQLSFRKASELLGACSSSISGRVRELEERGIDEHTNQILAEPFVQPGMLVGGNGAIDRSPARRRSCRLRFRRTDLAPER